MKLSEVSKHEFLEFMDNIDAVMFDCDGEIFFYGIQNCKLIRANFLKFHIISGVLWLGMEPMLNAQALVIKLRAIGKKIFFMTNNSTSTREEFLEKFNKLGFDSKVVSGKQRSALHVTINEKKNWVVLCRE